MNTKAIYMPNGKAGEYAKYACNFYIGCSNNCAYCYCKKGVLGHAMGKPIATLKKCFKDEKHALEIFRTELNTYIEELRKHGLFFSFTTDPMLPETRDLHFQAIDNALSKGVPCQILTKCTEFIYRLPEVWIEHDYYRKKLAFGFTLTGCDELEPGASTNGERIDAMKYLHGLGFKTFASIEPIIDIRKSSKMIGLTFGYCDLYKIGVLSGNKDYSPNDIRLFMLSMNGAAAFANIVLPISNHLGKEIYSSQVKIYMKDSMYTYSKVDREKFEEKSKDIFVDKNYNIFN